jgi:hypothetical protein
MIKEKVSRRKGSRGQGPRGREKMDNEPAWSEHGSSFRFPRPGEGGFGETTLGPPARNEPKARRETNPALAFVQFQDSLCSQARMRNPAPNEPGGEEVSPFGLGVEGSRGRAKTRRQTNRRPGLGRCETNRRPGAKRTRRAGYQTNPARRKLKRHRALLMILGAPSARRRLAEMRAPAAGQPPAHRVPERTRRHAGQTATDLRRPGKVAVDHAVCPEARRRPTIRADAGRPPGRSSPGR